MEGVKHGRSDMEHWDGNGMRMASYTYLDLTSEKRWEETLNILKGGVTHVDMCL